MKPKFSLSKSVRVLVVLAGLALAAVAGQAVLAKSDDRVPETRKPEVVNASRIEITGLDSASRDLAVKLSTAFAAAPDRSALKGEAQAGDDKGMIEAQPGDDKGMGEAQPNDDKGLAEAQPGDDKGMDEAQPGDDKNLIGSDDQGMDQDDAGHEIEDQKATGEIEFSGAVTAISGSTLTVNGMSVVISNLTEVKGSPMVGDMVKVEGSLQADHSVQAREIKLVDQSSSGSHETAAAPILTSGDSRGDTSSTTTNQGTDHLSTEDHGGRHGGDDQQGHH